MPVGFQAFNDSGGVQIDSSYKNLCLISKGTITTNEVLNASTTNNSKRDFTISGVRTPFLLVRPISNVGMGYVTSVSGGVASMSVRMQGAIGQTCDYWIFDQPPAPPAHGSGLQVFTSAGECAFDSSYKYLRVVDLFQYNPLTDAGTNKTYPAGRTYACQALSTAVQYVAAGAGRSVVTSGGFKAISNGFSLGLYQTGEWNSSVNTSRGGIYLVGDITGY